MICFGLVHYSENVWVTNIEYSYVQISLFVICIEIYIVNIVKSLKISNHFYVQRYWLAWGKAQNDCQTPSGAVRDNYPYTTNNISITTTGVRCITSACLMRISIICTLQEVWFLTNWTGVAVTASHLNAYK